MTVSDKMNISILGCGWYGLALAVDLIKDGNKVKGSTTSAQKMEVLAEKGIAPYQVIFEPNNEQYNNDFFNCDVLIIAIPPKARSGQGANFIYKIERIINAIKKNKAGNVILISSTGVYADINTEVDENTAPQPNTESGRVLLQAEDLFKAESQFKTTIIRFAGLIGPGRDAGRFFAGKKDIPNGNAPVNLIYLDDCIGITKAILNKHAFGYLFNAASPQHPTKTNFYTKAAAASNLEKPEFINELNQWKIVKSINVEPILGYQYTTNL